MALLHIFDGSNGLIWQTADARGEVNQLPVSDVGDLLSALLGLKRQGASYDRILFETHGSPGKIWFGDQAVSTQFWRSSKTLNFSSIVKHGARIYFNGCNVAEGNEGWKFLASAAEVFLNPGGGEIFGQTSIGFGNPFTGHVVHLWGTTRVLYVDGSGRITEQFAQ